MNLEARTPHLSRAGLALAGLALALSACATPASRRDVNFGPGPAEPDTTEGGRTSTPATTERVVEEDRSDAIRDAVSRTRTSAERMKLVDTEVATAQSEGRYADAVTWLVEAEKMEGTSAAGDQLRSRALSMIDGSLAPIDARRLLERTKAGAFPHEHLLFKLGILQDHTRDVAAAQQTLADYLQQYPTGAYAERAQTRLDRIRAMQRVDTKTIGVLLPLSGRNQAYGQRAREAVELAFQGSSVRVVVKDTRDDEAHAAEAVEQLVSEEGAIALLGPVFRTESRAAAVMAQRLGVPLLTITAAAGVSDYGPWVFSNGVTNEAQTEAVVDHAMKVLGLRSFAILHPRHPYGEQLRDAFWEQVEARGGEIRGVESYAIDDTTFSGQVKSLVGTADPYRRADYREAIDDCKKQPDSYRRARCRDDVTENLAPLIDFDGLFIPDSAGSVRMIAAALAAEDIIVEKDPRRLRIIEKALGRTPKVVTLMGASEWNKPKITESTGRTLENAIFTDGFFASADDETTARFVQAFRERFGRTPGFYPEALLYDSARILRQVVQQSAPSSRMDMREALRAVNGFPGVTGRTSFGGKTAAKKTLKILTISEGQIVEVPPVDGPPGGMTPGSVSPGGAAAQ